MEIGTDREEKKLGTIINTNSDILILLDHHLDQQKLSSLIKNNRQMLSKFSIYGTPSLKRGILVLVKKSCGCKITNIKYSWESDVMAFDIILPDMSVISTLAVYAPSHKDIPSFWEHAYNEIAQNNNDLRLVLGDFNCTMDHSMDSSGYKTDPHTKSRAVLKNWLESETFIDTFRHFYPDTKSFTYRTRDCKLKSRLDYCFSSPNLIPNIKQISHHAHNYLNTDHSSTIIDIDLTNTPRGKGIFRCPPNAHNDIAYQKLIKNSIKRAIFGCVIPSKQSDLELGLFEARIKLEEELHSLQTKTPLWNTQIRQNSLQHTIALLLSQEPTNEALLNRPLTISKPQLLEFILMKMKDDTIVYSSRENATHNNTIHELKNTLQELISEPESAENALHIHETQTQLEDLETKLLFNTLSKKANFNLLENERPSKAFLSMENSKQGYSEVTKLRIPNTLFNHLLPESAVNMKYYSITNSDLIRYEMTSAFQSIFNAQPNLHNSTQNIIGYLNSDGDSAPYEEVCKKRISPETAHSMEGLLTLTELTDSLFNHMKGGSSPGIDGFTVNHLRTFWHELKHITQDALNCSFGTQLTQSLRKAVIKLIRKGTKDPTLTGNYRPISLLSIFYKLASCCITQRIKPAIETIIGRQQKAYLKSNNIGSVIINLINMMKHVSLKKKDALILCIDFRKAFDSLDYTFMHNTLSLLGFGPDIITWIKLFFTNRDAQILMGGHMSEKILLSQGVPQGDVISPYIFILMVEILLIKINHTKNLKGITYAQEESRSETFADDTTIFIERNEHNLRHATKYITQFHSISGLACNLDKTVVIPIGSNTNTNDQLCPDLEMEWKDSFTILGFHVDSKLKNLEINFTIVKDKIKKIISTWKPYNLSLRGRITISKVKLVSQITYISTVLDIPNTILDEIQELINNFVMGIKSENKHWISKDLLYTPSSKGGFGIIRLHDFTKAIKCSWVKRYCIDKLDDHWADKLDTFFNLTPDTRFKITKFGPERFNSIINEKFPGLSSIFLSYKTLKQNFPTAPESLDNSWLCQPIFYNLNFTRKVPKSSKTTFLRPTFYGLPDNAHTLTVQDFYPNGKFITLATLNALTNSNLMQMQYKSLEFHIKSKIGLNKHYDAIPKLNLPQKRHTHSTIGSLFKNIKKGSGVYRKIISRSNKNTDIHNPYKWKAKINDNLITRTHVKQSIINLQSKYLSSDIADVLSRLKLGKTLFGNQLCRIGITDTPYCNTCEREISTDISETISHATYECSFVSTVIAEITSTFFPNMKGHFHLRDIILATITNKHHFYEGNDGQQLASIIWDIFLCYIMKCRSAGKTPIPEICLHEIRSQLNRILKILPKSKIAIYVKANSELFNIIKKTNCI